MKKILLTICIFTMLVFLCSGISHAKSEVSHSNLEEYVISNILNGEEHIDIQSLNMTKDEVSAWVEQFIWEHPTIAFCITSKGTTSTNDGLVFTIEFRYDNKNTIRSRHEYINMELDKIVANINPAWSQIQKILWINDYICDTFKYDIVSAYNSLDDFLNSGVGICEAYTNLFTALCQKVDIPVSYAYSNEINHIWNLVYIDNNWYHVDTTWNDSYKSRYGQFLLSDEKRTQEILASDFADVVNIVSPYKATSTDYDNAFWRHDVYGSFVHDMYASYYVNDGVLYKVNLYSMSPIALSSLTTERWNAPDNQYYLQKFVDIEDGGDYIYFNTPNSVYRLNKSTFEKEHVFTVTDRSQIYSVRFQDGVLKIGTNTDIDQDFVDFIEYLVPDVYMVSYIVNDKEVYVSYYTKNSTVTPPSSLNVPGYQFVSWQGLPEKVTEHCSVYANMIDRTKPIKVTFIVDNEIYYEYQAVYGEVISLPGNPVKPNDQYYVYDFTMWYGYELGMIVEQDMVFHAQFEKSIKNIIINFYHDGQLINSATINAGSKIPFPSCDKTLIVNGKPFVFIGWDTSEKIAYENMLINAIYAEQNKMCSVKYYVAGQLVHEEKVVAGTKINQLSNVPVTDESYIFNGWAHNLSHEYIIDDVRFDAIIEPAPSTIQKTDNDKIIYFVGLGLIVLALGSIIVIKIKEKQEK